MTHTPAMIKFEKLINIFEVVLLIVILTMAFAVEFVFAESPCPLCLLQRVGFLGMSIGFLLNLKYSIRPNHYALSQLSALFTAFVALRQISLHVLPDQSGYGRAVLGLHLYTWSFIVAMATVLFIAVILSLKQHYNPFMRRYGIFSKMGSVLLFIMMCLICTNIATIYQVCGLQECPENPVTQVGTSALTTLIHQV